MGRVRNRLFGHTGWIQAVNFREDDDGATLASADDDTVRVWNVLRGDCLHRLSVRLFRLLSIDSTVICSLDCQ